MALPLDVLGNDMTSLAVNHVLSFIFLPLPLIAAEENTSWGQDVPTRGLTMLGLVYLANV